MGKFRVIYDEKSGQNYVNVVDIIDTLIGDMEEYKTVKGEDGSLVVLMYIGTLQSRFLDHLVTGGFGSDKTVGSVSEKDILGP